MLLFDVVVVTHKPSRNVCFYCEKYVSHVVDKFFHPSSVADEMRRQFQLITISFLYSYLSGHVVNGNDILCVTYYSVYITYSKRSITTLFINQILKDVIARNRSRNVGLATAFGRAVTRTVHQRLAAARNVNVFAY